MEYTIKDKAVFIVLKYPYNHSELDGTVPVGAMCDLRHLSLKERAYLVERGLMEPATEYALTLGASEKPEKPKAPPKLNKYGLPFGQVPKKVVSKKMTKTSKESK